MSINSVGFTSNVVVRNSGAAKRPAFSGEPAPIDSKDSEKKGFNSAAVLIGLAAAGAIAAGVYLKMGKPVQAEKLIKSTMPKLKKCTNFSDVKILNELQHTFSNKLGFLCVCVFCFFFLAF